MKAIVYEKYGSPDVLKFQELPKPTIGDNEILVKVHAASVNPYDWHMMRGDPIIVRMRAGLLKPNDTMLGEDLAGQVEAVGKAVTEFKPGDAVLGSGWSGAFAEYAICKERYLIHKPSHLTYEEAASIPMAAITALQGLRDNGKITTGQKVLINGAGGGIGTFAIQIAKSYGAHVTGVCSSGKVELVRSLGADEVVDYKKSDFTQNGQKYDLILENALYRSVSDYKNSLTAAGVVVIIGGSLSKTIGALLRGKWNAQFGGMKVEGMLASIHKKDLQFLKELIEAGKVTPVVGSCYPLAKTAEAIRHVEEGHTKGKVVIVM